MAAWRWEAWGAWVMSTADTTASACSEREGGMREQAEMRGVRPSQLDAGCVVRGGGAGRRGCTGPATGAWVSSTSQQRLTALGVHALHVSHVIHGMNLAVRCVTSHPHAADHMRAVAPVPSTASAPPGDVRSSAPSASASPSLLARNSSLHAPELSTRVTEAEIPMRQAAR